ncbi:MAG: cytochrome C oxidase subunit IV family protein [Chloroflexi bacterium]|nr:cytochrome C oxidase subunit IV family protein [Chloroflexota bacterium]MDA1297664.1 cytochrome C oxidase subunit IV family protein [Chloroflexota bacterium]
MPEESKPSSFTTHDGKGWWNLPKTAQEQPNPPYEGPVGGPWLRQVMDWVTYAGVSHASVRGYLVIAVILSIFTFLEWRLFSIEAFGDSGRNAIMLALSTVKFTMVVAFFMHLRFERKYYAWIFGASMGLGVGVFLALLLLQRHHGVG